MTFDTANGSVPATEVIGLDIDELDERVHPYILPSTPALLSVGRRCMKMGYTFVWKPREEPYFITPSGKVVVLEVINDIAYLEPGNRKHLPRKLHQEDLRIDRPRRAAVPVVPDPEASDTAPAEGSAGGDQADEEGEVAAPEEEAELEEWELDEDAPLARRAPRTLPPEHFLTHKPARPDLCEACRRGK